MAQMITTLFYSSKVDAYYPSSLSKRSKIFLSPVKLKYLLSYYNQAKKDEFRYLQAHLLMVIEIFTSEIMDRSGLDPGLLSYVNTVIE
ncbi:hypothetical protein ECANGB1_32 [Enterospora canceri]|uniref:Uncharacterized protein n=1 Tax=Enterospora canceri TaxID=1081671 RepID=A0A1Y1S8D5_9MICR|nr:hypothetical protein ECANGB1_32 [Enterospora canceri]